MIPNHRRPTESCPVPVSASTLCVAGVFLWLLALPVAAGPRLEYEPDKIDFGTKPRGVQLSGVFVIKNTGDEKLVVSGLEASCGCVTSGQDKFSLKPGERTELSFTLDTQSYSDGSIKLKTNQPDRPQVMLPIHITVLDEVQLSDEQLSFGSVSRGETPAVSVTVWASNAHKPVRIRSLRTNMANVELWHKGTIDIPNRPGEAIWARLKTANMPPGRFGGWADLVLDLPKKPTIRLEISGKVIAGTVLRRRVMRIRVRKRALRRDVPRAVILENTIGQKFRILRATSSDRNVTVDFDSGVSAAQHKVTVTLSKGAGKTNGMVLATVRLFTDNRKTPHTLNVYYAVR